MSEFELALKYQKLFDRTWETKDQMMIVPTALMKDMFNDLLELGARSDWWLRFEDGKEVEVGIGTPDRPVLVHRCKGGHSE